MAGPGGISNTEFFRFKNMKKNWRFLVPCGAIFGVVFYFWLYR